MQELGVSKGKFKVVFRHIPYHTYSVQAYRGSLKFKKWKSYFKTLESIILYYFKASYIDIL